MQSGPGSSPLDPALSACAHHGKDAWALAKWFSTSLVPVYTLPEFWRCSCAWAVCMETSTATIGIRGTHYGALLCRDDCAGLTRTDGQALANGLHLDVEEGCITAATDAGRAPVCLDEFAYVRDRSSLPITVPPETGIRVPVADWPQRGPGGVDGSPECLF